MRKNPERSSSPESLAQSMAMYWNTIDKKKREILVVEQSIREAKFQEATLRARLLECRRGCSQAPEESSTEDSAGTSTSAGQIQGSAEAAEASGGDDDSGISRDRRSHAALGSSRLVGSPVSPSPKLLEGYRARYRSTVDKKRQEMLALEQSIRQAEVEEAQLRALLLGRRSKGGEAPAEPGTEGQPPPSTSTAQSEGPGAQGGPGIHAVPPETESAELPEATSPVPGCSWWSNSPPVTSLRPRPKVAEPGCSVEERVTRLQSELRLLRARRTNLTQMRRVIRKRWRNEDTFVKVKLQRLNKRRKAKNASSKRHADRI
ncbi:hypothetical protein TGME49_220650 [Toxoplasma gondii ME49]|uniref:Uncharacterized protein n=1 Tax=Toxoplasma gondii (strain ATCC 50611 / Me49) TaxID=508771 RepID=S8FBV8_TOXGM|nr:hypothetical protein TGME49_220650 [Toxoplasma gondii ME49]EPT31163.1 hypothetical protein TGME49_220650 [Toxoplasma gondii ME49]|eukprot:XP_018637849.1 hypothetical protein TGME49_220650 [Toxoplasma gondii ME49]